MVDTDEGTASAGARPHVGRRATGAWVAVAVVVALTLVNAAWLVGNRADGPFDIDEAGYLAQATGATADVQAGNVARGPIDLWRFSANAPLLAEATIAAQLVFGRTATTGLLVNLGFFVALGGATYLLARRWLGWRWAVLALLAVLTVPGITGFARSYVFALAATATFTAATAALVRSERFARRTPAVAFGVAVGLTALSRTVMLAFVPGLVLAGLLAWWQNPPEVRRRVRGNVALAGVAMVVVTASWYVFSTGAVLDYLFDFGYGEASTDYASGSLSSARYWLADLADLVGRDLYLPLTLVLLTAGALGLRSLRRSASGSLTRRALRSDLLVAALPPAAALAALLTSGNTGYGFTLPLVPTAVVLATVLLSRVEPQGVRRGLAVALGAVALVNLVMTTSLVPALGPPRTLWANDWTSLTVIDGRSNIARYLEDETSYALEEDGSVPATQEGWLDSARATREALRAAGARPGATRTVIAIDGPLYNLNTVALVGELDGEDPLRLSAFDAGAAPVTEAVVADALAAAVETGATTLVTGPEGLAWRGTGTPVGVVEAGAEAAGFTRVDGVDLPDGRSVTIWSAPDGSN